MKKRILTLLAVLALLVVCAVFTVQAEETFVDLTTFQCPCSACDANRDLNPDYVLPEEDWITGDALTAAKLIAPDDGDHYYIDKDMYPTSQISVGSGEEAVYLMDNSWICQNGTARATLVNGGIMHLIGNGGDAVYLTKSTGTANGIMGQISSGGELHIYGQTTVKIHASRTATSTNSGLFRLYSGLLHIHDSEGLGLPTDKNPTLNAPALANTTASLGGISNLENANCRFVMDAGTLNGTTTCYRGGVLHNAGGSITINGGTINGGTAGNCGGAIYNASGTVTITGGTITGGTAGSSGGVIYNAGTMTITDATVSGGNATSHGGTIAMDATGAVLTIDGTTEITGGVTAARGATIYLAKGTLNIGGSAVINAATAENAAAMYRGIYMLNGAGTCNLYGNAVVKSGNLGNGDAIGLMYGTLNLMGNASVTNETNAYVDCIYRWKDGEGIVQVAGDWAGTAGLQWEGVSLTNHGSFFAKDGILWGSFDEDYVFTENTTANAGTASGLHLDYASHGNPPLYYFNSADDGNGFVTPRAQVIGDGESTWYLTLAQAVYGYIGNKSETKYIKLWTNQAVNLNNTFYIDFNGYDSKATKGANGKIYAFDSTTEAGEVGATLLFDPEPVTQFNGQTYVCSNKKIYNVGLEISHVTLRSTANDASLYYTAAFNMHDDLKTVVTAGVAVTLKDDASATELADYLYTEDAASNGEYTSAIVKGIINKDGDENGDRAVKPIYARAYISVGGEIAMSDAANWSLNRVVNAVTAKYNAGEITDADQVAAYEALYAWCSEITLPEGEWTTKETI